jgi:hypothetical protein
MKKIAKICQDCSKEVSINAKRCIHCHLKRLKRLIDLQRGVIRKPIIGLKFGKLTVISLSYIKKNGESYYNCLCDCGKTKAIGSGYFKRGGTKSCGCLGGRGRKKIPIVGLKFGKLTVLSFSNKKDNNYYYNCLCECGNPKIAGSSVLKRGYVKSCGCIRRGRKKAILMR